MHEASLVRDLLQQVSQLMREHQGESVEAIRIEIGPLSGVERPLLEIAFAQQAPETACRGAQLQIETIALSAACRDCGEAFCVERFRFVCPACQSSRIQVTGGDEIRLLDVSIRTNRQATELAADERETA